MAYTPTYQDALEALNGANVPQENGVTQAFSQSQLPSLMREPSQNPLIQSVLGAGDAIRNTLAGAVNLLPGVNIPMAHTGAGTPYNIGNIAGNIAAFMGGGEGLDALRAMGEGAPLIGGLAQTLGSSALPNAIARRAIGAGMYGAATNPGNVPQGTITGALGSIGADALLGLGGKLPQIASYFQPQKYIGNILQTLGGGQSLGDAAQSVASDIKNAYQNQKEVASGLYNSVRSNLPSGSIYNEIAKPNSSYLNLPEKVTQYFTPDINDLNESFMSNPTFDNAHALQSQLGATIRKLQSGKGAPDIATLNTIQSLNKARNSLQTDMNGFLSAQSPEIAQQYQNASDYFLNNVAPYRSNPSIFAMANGQKTNIKPSNLANIFAAPDDNLSKVLEDLPQSTLNKIIFTKLGQRSPSTYPDRFLNAFSALDQQGLTPYISPELDQMMGNLKNKLWAKNIAQTAAGGLVGGAMGLKSGIPEAIGVGAMGLGVGRPIMNYLQYRLPLEKMANAIQNVAQNTAQPARNAILSNLIANTGS